MNRLGRKKPTKAQASADQREALLSPVVVNGWSLYAHPLFLGQLDDLTRQVEALKAKDPQQYHSKNATKRLAAMVKLVFEVIPADPTRAEYRQGDTLGPEHRHWFRAKFFQQYRLFFRYLQEGRVIVFAWVNDDQTKRAYGSADDAYRVFASMLDSGNPPNDWSELLRAARQATQRLTEAHGRHKQ